jgi:uncharacterized membrane protein YphA (DoxX/SURF4 family)
MATDTTSAPSARPHRLRHLPTVARLLLGLVFFGSGLAGLLMPVPALTSPPMSEGLVALLTGFVKSGYLLPLLKVSETVVGALLLSNRFVPLALTVLAPLVVNIVAVHLFLDRSGLAIAAVILVLHLYLAWTYREAYRPMLAARVAP